MVTQKTGEDRTSTTKKNVECAKNVERGALSRLSVRSNLAEEAKCREGHEGGWGATGGFSGEGWGLPVERRRDT